VTSCPEKSATLSLALTLPSINRFSIIFTDKLSSKFLEKWSLNILLHLKRITTLPCKMFVLKNRNDPKLSEANFVRLCHLKQFLRNIHPRLLTSFFHWQKDTYSYDTEKLAAGWPPVTDDTAVMKARHETRWNLLECPKLVNRAQPLVGQVRHIVGTCGGDIAV